MDSPFVAQANKMTPKPALQEKKMSFFWGVAAEVFVGGKGWKYVFFLVKLGRSRPKTRVTWPPNGGEK